MQSEKSVEIQRLRGIALNEAEAPVERLVAARRLLSKYGPSERNIPVVRKVVKLFENDANADVAERCLKLKAQLLKRLELQEVARVPLEEDDADREPIANGEPETIEAEPAPAQQQPDADDDPQPPYPPRTLLFPPPPEIYTLGSIDMQLVARRMIDGGARDLHESPGRQDVNEAIIRIALDLPQCIEVTEGICQKTWFALQLEPWAEDPRIAGRYRYWPRNKLFGAIYHFANANFGPGLLPDAPPSVACVRELIEQAPQSAYVRLEQLPRALAAARFYRHLPGFNELLAEIEGGNHV